MRSHFFVPSVALLLLCNLAFAQSEAQKPSTNPAPTEAQRAFALMKTLAGSWEGPVTLNPPLPGMAEDTIRRMEEGELAAHVTMRVTSRGNVIVHEMQEANTPLDPSRYDHPVTMFYVDADQLNLVHYCDAGNRPRMNGKVSPDGKTVEFDFLDLSGGNQYGHMHHAVFTILDENHHVEDWTFWLRGDMPVHARADLRRTDAGSGTSGN